MLRDGAKYSNPRTPELLRTTPEGKERPHSFDPAVEEEEERGPAFYSRATSIHSGPESKNQ